MEIYAALTLFRSRQGEIILIMVLSVEKILRQPKLIPFYLAQLSFFFGLKLECLDQCLRVRFGLLALSLGHFLHTLGWSYFDRTS